MLNFNKSCISIPKDNEMNEMQLIKSRTNLNKRYYFERITNCRRLLLFYKLQI